MFLVGDVKDGCDIEIFSENLCDIEIDQLLYIIVIGQDLVSIIKNDFAVLDLIAVGMGSDFH